MVGRVRAGLLRRLLPLVVRTHARSDLEKVGSAYGGWIVPLQHLRPGSICYCGGVGEDITFDIELAVRFHCEVFAFDPTPRAIRHVAEHAPASGFRFLPVGLWSHETSLRFYAPANPTHVSHSVKNLQRTSDFFVAPCKSVVQLMEELGHDRVDLLKLDIEGAEHEVVESLLGNDLRCPVLCVEFDQPSALWRIARTVRRLQRANFRVAAIDGWNFTFLHETMYAAEPLG